MKTFKVTNIDGIIKTFNEVEMKQFAKDIFEENESEENVLTKPNNLENGLKYITNYCPNLTVERITT